VKGDRKRGKVIVTDRGAEVCQRCLVKWARNKVRASPGLSRVDRVRYLCNTCKKKEER
jgi:hypothetical protein